MRAMVVDRVVFGRRQPVCAFDVDGTLIGSIRSDRLRPGAGQMLTDVRALGVTCVLWSAGGADYARRRAVWHEIAHHFSGFYGKLDRGADGRYLVDHVPPLHRPDVYVDDSPVDLPVGALVIAVPQYMGGRVVDDGLSGVVARLGEIVVHRTGRRGASC